ncbi:MAG: hypothetical protein C4529_03400 [Deltaproteobacteria bacterium]|nr:MAG: hypothetical protein C4529_03400 [Deltaproteobacteria bacterium]
MKRPALLTLALLLLAAFFGWEIRRALFSGAGGQGEAEGARQDAWKPGAPSPDPASPPDLSPVAAAVAARPLFRPDRQPFREQSASAAPARNYDAELSRFTLLGVLDFGDGLRGVVVSKSGTRSDRWELRAGDALPGFAVKEVRTDALLLSADGRELTLPLYAGPPSASGGAVRTEVPRRDAASPKAAAAASPAAPAPPALPPRGPAARQLFPVAPGPAAAIPAPPAPAPMNRTRTAPIVAPRYIPGRR